MANRTTVGPVARRRLAWLAAMAIAVTPLASCSSSGGDDAAEPAAKVEAIPGSELRQVTLTALAAKRLDLHTEKAKAGTGSPIEIPYGAVLYDPDGKTWTFTKVKGLTFRRRAIVVASITGDTALLTSGPPVGTEVVTLGANELFGAEIGVGDE